MNSLEQKLNELKLGRMRQVYPHWIEQAANNQMDYGEFLEQLLSEELVARQENRRRRRMQSANFSFDASLEQFDFTRHPELKRNVMTRFFDSSFMEKAGALLLIGPSGVGNASGGGGGQSDGSVRLHRPVYYSPETGERGLVYQQTLPLKVRKTQ
jgi:DNA replication protein DnaC